MTRMRLILCLCLTMLAASFGEGIHAQVPGSPLNERNAIDFRYQRFDDQRLTFADSIGFRDRFYTVFNAGIEGRWKDAASFEAPMVGLKTRLGFGYRLTPVHAFEADFLYGNRGGEISGGMNFEYVMNLNNLALRRDGHNKLEALFVSGLSWWQDKKIALGLNTGIRLQWNPGKNAGFFIEPRLNVMSGPNFSKTFTTVPSVSFGFTLRYHKPDYYLWDYLTPFAIKTNMLYDLGSALNIGLEVPILDNWSVAFEWTAPWWSNYDKQIYIQMMLGGVEGRYWFGNREDRPQLTGWFSGLSLQGGVYDFMFDPVKGIQGEFQAYSAVGGYAHPINKSGTLRMEYALGIGYMRTEYVKYWWDGFDYTLIAPSPQTWVTNWFGPTKLSISLVYMLKLRSKVGGRP